MYRIYKITSHPVVDFAAQELKKYLRMLMPRCGEIPISYDPDATEGFRLGVMADFSLDTQEAEDLSLDDILHIDTDENGGILAGSNPRSVLLAMYKYLTLNGCRWLYPGVDGEFIPIRDIAPTFYHKMADCRYRGQCNEGAESQQAMLETIDFSPKVGLNVYMLEFDNPTVYYNRYYNHSANTANRAPEPVSADTVLQWKRACEAEIAKRGLQFHDIGHGWTAEAFGIDSKGGWSAQKGCYVPQDSVQYLAQINGERKVFLDIPLNTNFCMSNREARRIVTEAVCDYARKNPHVDYLHVWLADWQKNHCECAACREKTPSDWYVVLLNDIDRALTEQGLNNRIGVAVYSDTAYEPQTEKINNPQRFFLILGAIARSYTYSVPENPTAQLTPFVLNQSGRIQSMEEYIVRLKLWQEKVPSPAIAYEYHFWKHQFYAPGVLSFARRLYEDVLSYRKNGLSGMIQDGSQRCFFPNGLCFYVYANTLFDTKVDYEALVMDYLRHAYGEAAESVKAFLQEIDDLMPQSYIEARHSQKRDKSQYFVPEMAAPLEDVYALCGDFEEKLTQYKNMPYRVQTVSVRLFLRYLQYLRGFSQCLSLKAQGKDEEAKAQAQRFWDSFGQYELELERYYDHFLMVLAQKPIFGG